MFCTLHTISPSSVYSLPGNLLTMISYAFSSDAVVVFLRKRVVCSFQFKGRTATWFLGVSVHFQAQCIRVQLRWE